MKKIFGILLIMLATTISAFGLGVDKTMSTIMNSWKGCHIDRVMDQWGYPTEIKTAAGQKFYIWRTENNESLSAYTKPVSDTNEKKNKKLFVMERIMEVDDQNIVVHGKWSGNDLPFTFIGVAKHWLNPEYELKK